MIDVHLTIEVTIHMPQCEDLKRSSLLSCYIISSLHASAAAGFGSTPEVQEKAPAPSTFSFGFGVPAGSQPDAMDAAPSAVESETADIPSTAADTPNPSSNRCPFMPLFVRTPIHAQIWVFACSAAKCLHTADLVCDPRLLTLVLVP